MRFYKTMAFLIMLAISASAGLGETSRFSTSGGELLSPSEANYHDFAETEAALTALDASSAFITLETIGYSTDYRTNPSNPVGYPIYALRISADTPASSGDRHDRNGALFDCGCHAREWLTSESCLELAEYLAANRTNALTVVPELLQRVDVWIIPLVNPSGRVLDDPYSGDPTRFFNTSPYTTSWRNNADTRLCNMGANPARNFSRGFNDAAAEVFCSSRYRGFAPFFTSEANALRQFIQNHTISYVVTSHSNGQEIWNQWYEDDEAGQRMIEKAAEAWRAGWVNPADQTLYDLRRIPVGGNNGQFSAWLANTSTRSGDEIDEANGHWGISGDLPMAGDFDGDHASDDVAVYRSGSGTTQYRWYYDWDHDADTDEGPVGAWVQQAGDRPFSGDFDRDGEIDDVAVFRPSDSSWYYDLNHNATTDTSCSAYGTACLKPFALDYDLDGYVDDVGAYCSSDHKWYYDIDHDCDGDSISPVGPWGADGDLPLAGDFDRDGDVDDVALYRPSSQFWYYDLNHDGNTDHASGPWGAADGLPFAGDFNPPSDDDDPDRLDDVGLFIPSTRTWQYDFYHNATFKQLDDGTRRSIQTIMLELPVLDDIYDSSMYIQAAGDGSNGFHPSANAVSDMIADSFIPMALYLTRQARAPGCPTQASGAADTVYCPLQDAGLVGAKFIPSEADLDTPGALRSLAAMRSNWSNVSPAREQLDAGAYDLVYRVQNFSFVAGDYRVYLFVKLWHCPSADDCTSSPLLTTSRLHSLAAREAESDSFYMILRQAAFLPGDWYEITLEVQPSAGGEDDFTLNDQKIYKFQLIPRVYLPLVSRFP